MANALYDWGKQQLLDAEIDWLGNTIKMVIVDTDEYTVNTAAHQWLSDIPVEARISTSPALTSKTVTGGVASAAGLGRNRSVDRLCDLPPAGRGENSRKGEEGEGRTGPSAQQGSTEGREGWPPQPRALGAPFGEPTNPLGALAAQVS